MCPKQAHGPALERGGGAPRPAPTHSRVGTRCRVHGSLGDWDLVDTCVSVGFWVPFCPAEATFPDLAAEWV